MVLLVFLGPGPQGGAAGGRPLDGVMVHLPAVRLPVEVEPGRVLEFEAALCPIGPAPDDDQRGHEADGLEVLHKLVGVPHLAVLRFQSLTAAGSKVDLGEALKTGGFGFVDHVISL
jgi:hypothetical protein